MPHYAQKIKIGSVQKKLLLLLMGGVVLGFNKSPYRCKKIIEKMRREWNRINQQAVAHAIQHLYINKMIDYKKNIRGEVTITLNDAGRKRTLTYTTDTMKIKKSGIWDKKWRVVLFDIPETMRTVRNALRERLRQLGFYEFQKSVFVIPYECQNEIDFLIELYAIRRFVRCITAYHIDNELHLRKIFDL